MTPDFRPSTTADLTLYFIPEKKPLAAGHRQRTSESCGNGSVGGTWADMGARGFGGDAEESKNPSPVSGTGSSTPRGLFHPNASTVTDGRCAMVAAILKMREIHGLISSDPRTTCGACGIGDRAENKLVTLL